MRTRIIKAGLAHPPQDTAVSEVGDHPLAIHPHRRRSHPALHRPVLPGPRNQAAAVLEAAPKTLKRRVVAAPPLLGPGPSRFANTPTSMCPSPITDIRSPWMPAMTVSKMYCRRSRTHRSRTRCPSTFSPWQDPSPGGKDAPATTVVAATVVVAAVGFSHQPDGSRRWRVAQ